MYIIAYFIMYLKVVLRVTTSVFNYVNLQIWCFKFLHHSTTFQLFHAVLVQDNIMSDREKKYCSRLIWWAYKYFNWQDNLLLSSQQEVQSSE